MNVRMWIGGGWVGEGGGGERWMKEETQGDAAKIKGHLGRVLWKLNTE